MLADKWSTRKLLAVAVDIVCAVCLVDDDVVMMMMMMMWWW